MSQGSTSPQGRRLTPSLQTLPPPPRGKTGWPWTRETSPARATAWGGRPWPRISIVTPSYNQGQFLEETLRSVLLQGYPNLEYAVFDGGSTDESVEILRKYAPWLSYWSSEKDAGQAHAINTGLARATGNIAAYLNSDDLYMPGALQHVAAVWHKPGFDVFVGKGQRIGTIPPLPSWFLLRRTWWLSLNQPFAFPFVVSRQWRYGIPQESTFWNHDRYRTLRLDESFHFCLDAEWFIRLYSGSRIVHSTQKVGVFRFHPEGKTTRMREIFHHELARLFQMYGESMDRVPQHECETILREFDRARKRVFARELVRRTPSLFTYWHPAHLTNAVTRFSSP